MMAIKMFDGNGAAVEAIRLARPGVIAAYPITPQSSIAEHLADAVAEGAIKAEYVRVESEHSAMSISIGAQLTGVRVATATASVGLALMHEVCGVAAGCRVPIVMPVVNRSLVAPWSLWCDHSDTMAERDTGWLQFYASTVQEILDLQLCAYRISEHEDVMIPSMVCFDGFYLSHSMQRVDTPSDEEAWDFVKPYVKKNMYLDTKDVMFINDLCPTVEHTEMKYQQMMGFKRAAQVSDEIFAEYEKRFGRKLKQVEAYRLEDAEVAVVTIGSMSGTGKYVVEQLREKGIKAGLLRICMFRPFPDQKIHEALKNIPVIGVIDRSCGLGGAQGPVCSEVKAAMYGENSKIYGYIGGIAGRDISDGSFRKIFDELLGIKEGKSETVSTWFDVEENAMNIREVETNANV
ncbi:pyruvate ferredoxin oxidoreductase [Lachnospiraceae bacterium ASD4241]|uniref:Pyruvate ferredoxin oxidoreductase n=2 Tax=Diplocloster modestus TaxID=2850322 RepID=A0ABS6KEE4_9FIRM|nr:pyruvate ferredoxin oxidoreductase [Diplocloster modestus]